MTTEEKYERIEQYLSGKLEGDALVDFEQQLRNDAALQNEVDLHREIEENLKGEKIHQLRDVLKTVDKKWQAPSTDVQTTEVKPTNRLKYIRGMVLMAASFLLLFFAYQTYFSASQELEPNLFAANFEPYKMILSERSELNDSTNIVVLNRAITAYRNQDYAAGATIFQSLQNQYPKIIAYHFYKALSLLGNGETAAAIEAYEQILKTPKHFFTEQSEWYLALAYLQKGDEAATKTQLQKIKEGAFQYSEAQAILKKLNE